MTSALPIDDHLARICARLEERRALVLVAEPGAGKTTRVPPPLLGRWVASPARVIVSQPLRNTVYSNLRKSSGFNPASRTIPPMVKAFTGL
jgi:HrpA-like RNA helicase